MSILSTPLEDLEGEQKVLASHLINRFHQLDAVFDHLQEQTERLAEDGERVNQRREALESIAESDDARVTEDVAEAVVDDARTLGEQSIATQTLAKQARSLYSFYVELANAVDAESLGIDEAGDYIVEIEEEIPWLDGPPEEVREL